MDPKIVTALIAATVAVVSAAISVVGNSRLARLNASLQREKYTRERNERARAVLSKYRDPLLHAAYDLQSKLFNILRQGHLHVYYVNGDESEREYTIQNSVYVVAQYLCWREIVRREVQHLDLGEEQGTRRLAELLDRVQSLFLTDGFERTFRIFRGEQRAIGEKMIERETETPGCIGYATFIEANDETFRRWFRQLEIDIDRLASDLPSHCERLEQLQRALIDLIDYLDPKCVRFQANHRRKV